MINENKIILLGNYTKDKQESMQRFCNMLSKGFKNNQIDVEIWKPTQIFGKFFSTTQQGGAKWMGYIDKWVIFPIFIRIKLAKKKYKNKNIRFHICDHSNAPYLKYFPKERTVITCHDVLAIRGALGFEDAYAPASKTGVIYQRWILKNLVKAKYIAAVSTFTLNQLKELNKGFSENTKNWCVIHNAFNAPFFPMKPHKVRQLLSNHGIEANDNYVLHIGTAHIRKNRNFLVPVLKHIEKDWNGKICFAGMPIDSKLDQLIEELNLRDRIISVVKPSHELLVALYSGATAFVFPSLSEGFGWPVIEAQACKTPVIASSLQPMPEVSGGAAIHKDPKDVEAFAQAILTIQDEKLRNNLIEEGLINIKRFNEAKIINKYLNLHNIHP